MEREKQALRYKGDIGEIYGRYKADVGERDGREGGEAGVGAALSLARTL